MVSDRSDGHIPLAVKILIAGGFGVGKTTLVGAVSEIRPLQTEEVLTNAGVGIDDVNGVEGKTTTTVAMDFGRISINDDIVLYLFGTPGQDRFAFLWDDLVIGALGAVVLVDTQRIEDSFPAIDYFEEHAVPFLLAVNNFDHARHFDLSEVREALGVDQDVPVLDCDARSRASVKRILVALTEEVLARRLGRGQTVRA
jgi:hypothetical protein